MIKNRYVFILWNKALFCRQKIIKDMTGSFDIINSFYIEWNEKLFIENLKALYGTKANNYKEKVNYIGKGPFYILVVEDNRPQFDIRENFNGRVLVNVNVFEKKWLYRKWTAGSFRIHASVDENETKHDLVVLLGNNYEELLTKIKKDSIIKTNTSGVNGFENENELCKSLELFGNNVKRNGIILCKSKKDIAEYIKANITENYKYTINFKDGEKTYTLLGVEEGDISDSLFESVKNNDDLLSNFTLLINDYLEYLWKNTESMDLKVFFEENKIDKTRKVKEKKYQKPDSTLKRIKNNIKYLLTRVLYKFE